MLKVLAFGASSSRQSINKQLATFAAEQFTGYEINVLDLNDFEMPLYSIDKERENGIPAQAHTFQSLISASDLIIISFAEHNGSYAAVFKNLMDWTSRIGQKIWAEKPMFLLSTSPGKRGGMGVLEIAAKKAGYMGGQVIAQFSLPSFMANFTVEEGIVAPDLATAFQEQLHIVKDYLTQAHQ